MLSNDSNSACGILYIDDEEKALKYFRMAFSQKFNVFTAESGAAGIEILRRESRNIGIVISDQRMPEMLGAEVLGTVRDEYPNVVRILTTAYSDLDSAIQAVNKGHIYQYVVKPWEIPELGMVLQRASDYYHVLSERNELLALKMTTLQRIICSDRLKWMLLASRHWSEAARSAFRRALLAFVNALPESMNPIAADASGFSARQFDIGTLIRDEFRNATRCVEAFDAAQAAAALDARLAAAAEALAAAAKVGTDSIEVAVANQSAPDVQITLRPPAGGFKAREFAKGLFGLLLERETSDVSLRLFETLMVVAAANGQLKLTIAAAGAGGEPTEFLFAFPSESPDSPDEVIGCLFEKFSNWDISKM